MIRTTLAVSTLVLLAGCADGRYGSNGQQVRYTSNTPGNHYDENRSVNNWGTATPRVDAGTMNSNTSWNRPGTTTVGPDGVVHNDNSNGQWSSTNQSQRNNSSDTSSYSSGTNANQPTGTWPSNDQNRTDTGMNRSPSDMRQTDQARQQNQNEQNRSNNAANQNNTAQNDTNQNFTQNDSAQNNANRADKDLQNQAYNNQNERDVRRDTNRVTPSQGDNQFGRQNATFAGAGAIDAYFAKAAACINKFEIEAGEVAVQRAQNQEVKNFAQMMVTEHKKGQSELDNILRQANWTAPAKLDSTHTEMIDFFGQLEGQQFDSEYMSTMAAGHAMAVSMFKDKAKTLKNSELRTWVERQVPALEKHLATAKTFNDRVRPTR